MDFSTFTAISEIFVTIGVFFVVLSNYRGKPFKWKLALGLCIFEFSVNMLYMVARMSQGSTEGVAPAMAALYAIHGTLSLIVFIGFATLSALAYAEFRKGKSYFQSRPTLTKVFLIFWTISVGSGELIYFLK